MYECIKTGCVNTTNTNFCFWHKTMSNNTKEYIVVHHSVSNRDNTTVQDIDGWHRERWEEWHKRNKPNIPYNPKLYESSLGYQTGYGWVILGDGNTTQTRSDDEEQAHTFGWNSKSIGVCLTGDFRYWALSVPQKKSLIRLLNDLRVKYNIPLKNVKVHGEIGRTECPGKNLASLIKIYRIPTRKSIKRQIAMLVEAIAKLQLLFNRLFRK